MWNQPNWMDSSMPFDFGMGRFQETWDLSIFSQLWTCTPCVQTTIAHARLGMSWHVLASPRSPPENWTISVLQYSKSGPITWTVALSGVFEKNGLSWGRSRSDQVHSCWWCGPIISKRNLKMNRGNCRPHPVQLLNILAWTWRCYGCWKLIWNHSKNQGIAGEPPYSAKKLCFQMLLSLQVLGFIGF